MSANVSSTLSFSSSDHCKNMISAFNVVRVLLLVPLSIIILYLGLQKWRQQHSLKTASNSDFFTYHLVAMELIWAVGWLFILCTHDLNIAALRTVENALSFLIFYGEMLFHVLTCVEQYLAVVHPVIYMSLKNTRGVRIRNTSIACVWVLSFVLMNVRIFITFVSAAEFFFMLAVTIVVTCYCSISVLCVLIQPRPGDGVREKERVDQSKQRAFYTIIATSATLWFWFVGILVAFALSHSLNPYVSCMLIMSVTFISLPSSLVSPLLYLHRAGKLTSSWCSRQ